MFKHIILFKSKKPDDIKAICQHVMSIKEEIPGLLNVVYAKNLTDYAKGYNKIAIMDFREKKDFADWSSHPYHQQVVNQLKEIAETLFFDYEC